MQASSNNIQDTARTDINLNPSNYKVNETPLYSNIPIHQSVQQQISYPQLIPIYAQNTVPNTGNSISSSMQDIGSELRNPIAVPSVPYVSIVRIPDGSQYSYPYPSSGDVILSRSAPAGQIRYDMNSYYTIQPTLSQYSPPPPLPQQQQQQYVPYQCVQFTYQQPQPIMHQQPLSHPISIPPPPSNQMEEEKIDNSPENKESLYALNVLSEMAEQFQINNNENYSNNNTDIKQQQQQQHNGLQYPNIKPAIPAKKRESRRVYETCSTCNQHKPLTEFTLKRTGEHTHTCKVCSERKKNYYKRNIVKKHKRDEY